jgi:hypothetical protein
MVEFKNLTTNIRSDARGIIVEPPEDPRRNGTIYVKITPPVSTSEPYTEVTYVSCEADRVELGWSDEQTLRYGLSAETARLRPCSSRDFRSALLSGTPCRRRIYVG